MASYTAVAKQNPGRSAWLVEFRHPLRNDSNNKPGRKLRKGLGTEDIETAYRLVSQLNELLADESLWSPGERAGARLRFDERVIEIFFSEIEARGRDPRQLRNDNMPLPGPEEGYASVVLLGVPGAGKTTIMRQLMGTDPVLERFPSTSVNRTTTFPLEVVTDDKGYRAIVTFMSEHEVRFEVEESVASAILEAVFGNKEQVAQTLLEKSDMRFRLKYALGTFESPDLDEDDPYDEPESAESRDLFIQVAPSEIEAMSKTVNHYVNRTIDLAGRYKEAVQVQNGPLDSLDADDKSAALDLIEEQARDDDEFLELVADILLELRTKFDFISEGRFTKTTSGWPLFWSYETTFDQRHSFLNALKLFSGIAKPSWGRLLTPVVNGMRVFGSFRPTWTDTEQKLVLLDTEGLGHKANVSADLPEQLIPLMSRADVVLVVDSAKAGMNVATGKALEGIVNAGFSGKAAILFTHMDQVKGDNLKGKAKYEHVFLSLKNVVENQISKNVSPEAARYLIERLRSNSFFVGKIQDAAPPTAELVKLYTFLANAKLPQFLPISVPTYSEDNLVLAVQKAIKDFRRRWQGYLGVSFDPTGKAQPWQRIKALSRRYAERWDDGYPLQPTSDLTTFLSASFSQFLENPLEWRPEPTVEQRREAIDYLKSSVTSQLPSFTAKRVRETPHQRWSAAYALRGTGSTTARKNNIEALYSTALPIPDASGDKGVTELLGELKEIFRKSLGELQNKVPNS